MRKTTIFLVLLLTWIHTIQAIGNTKAPPLKEQLGQSILRTLDQATGSTVSKLFPSRIETEASELDRITMSYCGKGHFLKLRKVKALRNYTNAYKLFIFEMKYYCSRDSSLSSEMESIDRELKKLSLQKIELFRDTVVERSNERYKEFETVRLEERELSEAKRQRNEVRAQLSKDHIQSVHRVLQAASEVRLAFRGKL